VAAYLEERIEQVLERTCFGGDETLEERVERLGFRQLVLYASCLLLKPDNIENKKGGAVSIDASGPRKSEASSRAYSP